MSYGALSLLPLVAAGLTADPAWRVILAGVAATAIVERLWFQAATFLRAQAGVREFALVELAHAMLQLAVPLPLALVWGLERGGGRIGAGLWRGIALMGAGSRCGRAGAGGPRGR